MPIPVSSYLFQAQSFVSGDDGLMLGAALVSAQACEQSGAPYPEQVKAMVRVAYNVLEVDAPEVAAEFGPPMV
ncbi:hypothetical protein [Prescottella subtropica]|uniref:hypothetical protein n=1 Tax=Prescottella subtropica TaxID=2545757 RepID=UPI0010F94F12|nr:hypothetical protein [Prescottella subtropica]